MWMLSELRLGAKGQDKIRMTLKSPTYAVILQCKTNLTIKNTKIQSQI